MESRGVDLSQMNTALTVTQLNTLVQNIFESTDLLNGITVRGEISNFTRQRSGHLFFSLKDETGTLRSVMFQSAARSLPFEPENGMKVLATGSVSVYVARGEYQLYVSSMQPDGVGALYLAYEQLKRKLQAEGLFDRKRPIPKYPHRIGVITSPTGAAVRDMIHILGRRYPYAEVVIHPALVQGEDAPASLIAALENLNRLNNVDVILIGRGGGSMEDLWAFNNEGLVRAIAASHIPVISAVGHETDFTICDFAADLRAPTPSAAAEVAVPDAAQLKKQLQNVIHHMSLLCGKKIERANKQLAYLKSSRLFSDPEAMLRTQKMHVASLTQSLEYASTQMLTQNSGKFATLAAKLQALSPLAMLARGYAVVTADGKTVHGIDDMHIGDTVRLRLKDGTATAEVKTCTPLQKGTE